MPDTRLAGDIDIVVNALPAWPRGLADLRLQLSSLPPLSPNFLPGTSPALLPENETPSASGVQPSGYGASVMTTGGEPGTIPGSALGDGSLDIAKFARTIRPVAIVTSLPSLPSDNYPIGSFVYKTNDSPPHLYKNVSNGWSKAIGAADIEANSITAGEIAAGAIGADEIASRAITADLLAAGTITAYEIMIGTITGDEIADGTVTGGTGGNIASTTITGGNIVSGTIEGDLIAASAINGVTISADSDINAYYFRAEWAFCIDYFDTDAHNDRYATLYGISSNSVWLWRSDNPIMAWNGLIAPQQAGPATDANSLNDCTVNGALSVDNESGRIYFRYGAVWHHVNKTAGFEIPVHETICPVCELPLLPGQDFIGRGDRLLADGAVHALYIHFGCAGTPMNMAIADDYDAVVKHPDFDADPVGKDKHQKLVDRLTRKARKALGLDEAPVAPPPPPHRPKFNEADHPRGNSGMGPKP